MKQYYESEVLYRLMERDGFNIPSSVPPYEAEIKAYLINQVKQAYPKLTDYEAEWLLYNYTKHLPADFPISSVVDVMTAHFENVVPFAYQSAILRGKTVANLLNFNSITSNGSKEGDIVTVSANGNTSAWLGTKIYLSRAIERGKKYIVMWNNLEYTHSHANGKMSVIQVLTTNTSTNRDLKLGQTDNDDKNYMIFSCNDDNGDLNKVKIAIQANTWSTGEANNTTIVKGLKVLEYQEGMENLDIPYFEGMQSVKMPVLTTSNGDGTKTNILTVNEDVTLRGIGDVQDTLDCLTGKVTERIGEIVLDGSENWTYGSANSTETIGLFYMHLDSNGNYKPNINNKLPSIRGFSSNYGEGIYIDSDINIRIKFEKLNTSTVDGFKQWLSNNPITIQYKLSQANIKTVDLTAVNENGEKVYFMPLEGTMHVSCASETIQPTFDMSVPVEATTQNLASFINLNIEGE